METEGLRYKQTEAIVRCLQLSESEGKRDSFSTFSSSSTKEEYDLSVSLNWKVLLFDEQCADIVAQLLHREDLRRHGVTLHLRLHSSRQKIEDAPAVYLVSPTKENIEKIIEDLSSQMYSSFNIHFSSKVSEESLNLFARLCAEKNCAHLISRICDEYVNFVSLGENMITLNQKDSYLMMNDNTLSQEVITDQLNVIVEGLVGMCVTWGRVPVIRSPPNCLAAEICSRLHAALQEMLRQPNNPFYSSSLSSPQRPVIVLFDRAIDLSVMLRHSFTYQPLVHDLLGMTKNRVSCDVVDDDKTENKTYDIAATDEFWRDNKWESFPAVAQHIQESVGEYQRAKEQLLSLGNSQGNDGEYNPDAMLGRTQDIGSFMSKMPELTRTKKLLDMHTNIATALLREINERSVVDFFELEHQIVTESSSSFSEKITKLLNGTGEQSGAMIDKIRLMLIYFLSTPKINQQEFESFQEILSTLSSSPSSSLPPPTPLPEGVDFADCMAHFKKKKTFGMSAGGMSGGGRGGRGGSSGTGAAGLALSQLTSFGGNILGSGIQKLSSGLGLSSNEYFRVTQLVASVMNGQPNPDTDPYLCLDPRSSSRLSVASSSSSSSSSPYAKRPFQEGFVFMIGGGSFLELENLHKFGKDSGKKIMYGCTEMLTPEDFLRQASEVGRKAK